MRDFTIEDVLDSKVEHPLGGYQSTIQVGEYTVSVVGGRFGLYGDFINTFELAIFNKEKDFVTKDLVSSADDDVIGWMPTEDMLKLVNSVVKREDLSVEK